MRRREVLLAFAAAFVLAGCAKQPKMVAVPPGATVLALGDSITFGVGATAETSYPTVLAQITGWKIVNAGVSGDTSAGALQRLPDLMKEHAPQLVLVSIGGNDFLRRQSAAQTRDNIRSICQQAAAGGAQVLLIAVPELSAMAAVARSLSDHPLYAELAKELKIPLHAGGWSAVLADTKLRSDAIHANVAGYAQFAKGVAETARKVGLLAK